MYKFIKIKEETNPFKFTNVEVTIDRNDIDLFDDELLKSFADFLQGCDFHVPGLDVSEE